MALPRTARPWGALGVFSAWLTLLGFTPSFAQTAQPPAKPSAAVPTVTLQQFRQAVQVATLAAERKLPALSLKAVSDALRGGPPQSTVASPPGIPKRFGPEAVLPDSDRIVEESLHELVSLWRGQGVPPAAVYDSLIVAVLPEARRGEVFLYPRPLGEGVLSRPRSVGRLLAESAAAAGRLDDLRRRLAGRQVRPPVELAVRVLLAQAALAGGEEAAANEQLQWLGERLQKGPLRVSSELACHAALPALGRNATEAAARPLLARAARDLSRAGANDLAVGLWTLLARHDFARGRPVDGLRHLKDLEAEARRTQSPDADYQRLLPLRRLAREYVRAGLLPEALDAAAVGFPARGFGAVLPTEPSNAFLTAFVRQLAGRPARERYNLLKSWTLPERGAPVVRVLVGNLPLDAPPPDFGAIPRPRASATSTLDLLVEAARDAGRLDDLAGAVEPFATSTDGIARTLHGLVQLARGQRAGVEERLKEAARSPRWADYLLARACRDDATLAPAAVELLEQLIDRSTPGEWELLPTYREALAEAQLVRLGRPDGARHPGAGLALWHPNSRFRSAYETGRASAWWVAHAGQVAHLTGCGQDYFLFDYPIAGSFTFSVESYASPKTVGQVGYAGFVFEPTVRGASQESSVFPVNLHDRIFRAGDALRPGEFNRLAVQAEPGKVRCLIDDKPFFEDADASPTSPWLILFCRRERKAVFRNPTLKDAVTIPREVRLTHGGRLEGWVCTFYYETQPPRLTPGGPADVDGSAADPSLQRRFDWSARNGEIYGRRAAGPADASSPQISAYQFRLSGMQPLTPEPVPSWLAYFRPLRAGETLRYEFYHKPGEVEVHPALGRLAFLLGAEGVRLHWLTEAGGQDWTGLAPDNAVEVPAERRGPTKLPLQPDAWNHLQVSLTEGAVVLQLNGAAVYERKLRLEDDRTFGLFHYKDRTAARVRNVILSGNWPTKITPKEFADSFSAAEDRGDAALRRSLIGETFFRDHPP